MAALLRHGARRIGGSVLQRTQAAAVAEERRRLMPRRLTTDARAPEEITRDIKRKQQELADAIAEGRRTLTASTNWRDCNQRQQVQQKKEELYEVLSQAEGWGNRGLLQTLAVHVKLRPDDPQWRRLRASKWATNVVKGVATVSFGTAVAIGLDALGWKVKSPLAEEREVV